MSYTLRDVKEWIKDSPSTWIPPEVDRWSVTAGDIVKLAFETPQAGESLWIKVQWAATDDKGRIFRGALMNQPITIGGLKKGDIVEFGPQNIVEIWEEPINGQVHRMGSAFGGVTVHDSCGCSHGPCSHSSSGCCDS